MYCWQVCAKLKSLIEKNQENMSIWSTVILLSEICMNNNTYFHMKSKWSEDATGI